MVLILDGNSEKGAYVRSNLCYLICLRHFIRSRVVTNRPIFFHAWVTIWCKFHGIDLFVNPLTHGWFSDPYFKVLWEEVKLNFRFFSMEGHRQQKVLSGQIFSGMGCQTLFWIKGKKNTVYSPPPPRLKG